MRVLYSGTVQGVGFRYTTKRVANGYDLSGVVRNLDDGRVELIAEGDKAELESFLEGIKDSEVGRFVKNQTCSWSEPVGEFRGFEIVR